MRKSASKKLCTRARARASAHVPLPAHLPTLKHGYGERRARAALLGLCGVHDDHCTAPLAFALTLALGGGVE